MLIWLGRNQNDLNRNEIDGKISRSSSLPKVKHRHRKSLRQKDKMPSSCASQAAVRDPIAALAALQKAMGKLKNRCCASTFYRVRAKLMCAMVCSYTGSTLTSAPSFPEITSSFRESELSAPISRSEESMHYSAYVRSFSATGDAMNDTNFSGWKYSLNSPSRWHQTVNCGK